jgi:CHAT domain-containing protein
VGNPTGDLPGSRVEAEQIASLLTTSGWTARLLSGSAASSASVKDGLARAELFHYAGHGTFSGREGWESELPLAGGGHLSFADILGLATPPRHVVLSSCETARTSSEGIEGLGLAHAFLAAGTETVIAPVRPIADEIAGETMRTFYGAFVAAPAGTELGETLRRTTLTVRAKHPDADWSAFRVLRR